MAKRIQNSKKKVSRSRKKETEQEDLMDELIMFREWKKEVLPELREMLLAGASASDIARKYARHATARMVSIALADPDPQKALTACKDIIDRAEGKATENKKIEHRLQDLDDRSLDSMLQSELQGMKVVSGDDFLKMLEEAGDEDYEPEDEGPIQ